MTENSIIKQRKLPAAGATSKYRPRSSPSLYGLSVSFPAGVRPGLALRIAVSVNGMGATPCGCEWLAPNVTPGCQYILSDGTGCKTKKKPAVTRAFRTSPDCAGRRRLPNTSRNVAWMLDATNICAGCYPHSYPQAYRAAPHWQVQTIRQTEMGGVLSLPAILVQFCASPLIARAILSVVIVFIIYGCFVSCRST